MIWGCFTPWTTWDNWWNHGFCSLLIWVTQQDNDSKHASKSTSKSVKEKNWKIVDCLSQSKVEASIQLRFSGITSNWLFTPIQPQSWEKFNLSNVKESLQMVTNALWQLLTPTTGAQSVKFQIDDSGLSHRTHLHVSTVPHTKLNAWIDCIHAARNTQMLAGFLPE